MLLSLQNLSVIYGKNKALARVTLKVSEGTVGLLGLNGAGKTSLLKAILGLVPTAEGDGEVFGEGIFTSGKKIRQLVGYMPETDCFIPGMNGVGFVQYAGELCGMNRTDAMQRAHEVLFYVGLGEARYRNVETYSAGMKQRIKLAQAIVHDPKVLFLDEPTNGMDPTGRQEMLNLIKNIASKKDISIILSSHLLPDVEYACEDIVILHEGKVLTESNIEDLRANHAATYEVRIKGDLEVFKDLLTAAGCSINKIEREIMEVTLPKREGTGLILDTARKNGVQIRRLNPSKSSLEDVFAKIVGEA